MVGSGVGGGRCLGDDGVHNSQGDGLFLSDGGIFEPVGLELPCEALVEPGVSLGAGRFSGVGQTTQEVGCCNCPHARETDSFQSWSIRRLEYLARRTRWA